MPLELTNDAALRSESEWRYSHVFAALGAFGVALQNYQGVVLFVNGLAGGVIPASNWLGGVTQILAIGAGGIASGMVNFWMNVALLDNFFNRMTAEGDYQYNRLQLTAWQKIQYFGGIIVFVVTGILFGLMAFTFAMGGALPVLSIVAGLFVAGIMTIQEVETWLERYDNQEKNSQEPRSQVPCSASQLAGERVGHLIAVGNVLALSLLFTLSLAQALIMLQVAAFPALIIGLVIAFTFGSFTEYFFYAVYLTEFCKDFEKNWGEVMRLPNAYFALFCTFTNAFVNGALTYAGVEMLTTVLLAAHIALPPAMVIIAVASLAAFFAGSASFILGLEFWRAQHPVPSLSATPEYQGENPLNTLPFSL